MKRLSVAGSRRISNSMSVAGGEPFTGWRLSMACNFPVTWQARQDEEPFGKGKNQIHRFEVF